MAALLVTALPRRTASPALATSSVVIAAAGDHGANRRTEASLAALDASQAQAYLALGDLDYDQTPSDAAWCDFVSSRLPALGAAFPFELLAGNHEDDRGGDGFILDHTACLPDRLGATGTYGAEYAFDAPADAPLVRVILIAAGSRVGGVNHRYRAGSARMAWLDGMIDGARTAGIPWVVVGMHKVCLSSGDKPCMIGSDLVNDLVERRVDIVLQGHEHNYQRSSQLGHAAGTCDAVVPGRFTAGCVADSGSDGTYVRGAGTVFVVTGTFGAPRPSPLDPSDPEAPYFPVAFDDTWGFLTLTVSADRLDARFVPTTGSSTDAFAVL